MARPRAVIVDGLNIEEFFLVRKGRLQMLMKIEYFRTDYYNIEL